MHRWVLRGDHTLRRSYKFYSENSLGDKEKNRNWLKKFEAKERHFHNGMVLQSLLGLNYGLVCPNGEFPKNVSKIFFKLFLTGTFLLVLQMLNPVQ